MVLDKARSGGQCHGLRQEEGCNDNADGFGLVVQRRGAGVDRVGGRSVGTDDSRRLDRIFGVKIGVMEGGLYPIIKTPKERSGHSLNSMELMLLSMGSSMGAGRLLLC